MMDRISSLYLRQHVELQQRVLIANHHTTFKVDSPVSAISRRATKSCFTPIRATDPGWHALSDERSSYVQTNQAIAKTKFVVDWLETCHSKLKVLICGEDSWSTDVKLIARTCLLTPEFRMHIAFDSRAGDDAELSTKIKRVLTKGAAIGQYAFYWADCSLKEFVRAVIDDEASEEVAVMIARLRRRQDAKDARSVDPLTTRGVWARERKGITMTRRRRHEMLRHIVKADDFILAHASVSTS